MFSLLCPLKLSANSTSRSVGVASPPSLGCAVEQHVFHAFQQIFGNIRVNAQLPGVDDAHGHAGLHRVVKEGGMDRFPHRFIAAEREGHIGDAAAHLGIRQGLLDDAGGFDEIHAVIVMFLDAGGDRENVRIENDVLRRKADLIDENAIAARANFHFAFFCVGLARFIERHHNDRRTIAARQVSHAR